MIIAQDIKIPILEGLLEPFPWVPKGHFSCRLQYEFQRFVSSTGNMKVLLSHTHSIVCALAYFEQKMYSSFYKRDIKRNFLVRALQNFYFFVLKTWKKPPSKVDHYQSKIIFSVLPQTAWSARTVIVFSMFLILDTNLWWVLIWVVILPHRGIYSFRGYHVV